MERQASLPPIFVGVPCATNAMIYAECAVAFMNLFAALNEKSVIILNSRAGSSIAGNRNVLTANFLNADGGRYDWMLCLDADMVPSADVAYQLWRTAEATKADAVSALYFDRRAPHFPVPKLLPNNPFYIANGHFGEDAAQSPHIAALKGVHEVEYFGMGAVLLHRRALDGLEYPWFEHTTDPGFNEDSEFCHKLRSQGRRLVLDADCRVGHMSVEAIGPRHWEAIGKPTIAAAKTAAVQASVAIRMTPKMPAVVYNRDE